MLMETEAKLVFVKSLQLDKDLFQPFSLRRREKAPGPNLASAFVLNFPRLILVILVTRHRGRQAQQRKKESKQEQG
jgi:hypothetical protein